MIWAYKEKKRPTFLAEWEKETKTLVKEQKPKLEAFSSFSINSLVCSCTTFPFCSLGLFKYIIYFLGFVASSKYPRTLTLFLT